MKTVMLCSVVGISVGIAAHAAAAPRSFPFVRSAMVLGEPADLFDILLAPVPGDLNSDGVPDLLVMRRNTAEVRVLGSVGRGLWGDPSTAFVLADGFVFQDAVATDLNADGIPDLAYWASREEEVYRFGVLLGDGASGFVALPATEAALTGVTMVWSSFYDNMRTDTIAVGDVTGDGVNDIVVAANAVLVLEGDGNGGYGPPEEVGTGAFALELIDADGDGSAEIAYSGGFRIRIVRSLDNAWVLEMEFDLPWVPSVPESIVSLESIDRPDAAPGVRLFAGREGYRVATVDVTGSFDGALGPYIGAFVERPTLLVADVVGGPEPELIVGEGKIYVDSGLDEPLDALNGVAMSGVTIAVADGDADGVRDVFLIEEDRVALARVETSPGGVRSFEKPVRTGDPGFLARQPGVATGDFDGDGRLDAFASSFPDSVSAVFYQEPDGTYAESLVAPTSRAVRVHTRDVDGDGLDDVLLANVGGDSTRIQAFFAEQGRSFAPRVGFDVIDEPRDIATLHADGDGRLDIGVQTRGGIAVLRQTAPRQFDLSHVGNEPATQIGISTGDTNGDGFDDVVIGTAGGFSVFHSNGDGTFGDAIPGPETGGATETLDLCDLDGDGDLDLVLLSAFGYNAVWVFENAGDGQFSIRGVHQLPPAITTPQWLEVGDVSADENADILVLGDPGLVHVLLGDGAMEFALAIEIAVEAAEKGAGGEIMGPNQLALADMDNDGFNDMVSVGVVGEDSTGDRIGGVSVYHNSARFRTGCPADLAPPSGVLDLADITAFVSAFVNEEPEADLGARFGVFDLADLVAFVEVFVSGCD